MLLSSPYLSIFFEKAQRGKKVPLSHFILLPLLLLFVFFFLICEFKKHSKKLKITEYLATFYIPPFSLINLGV